MPVPETYILMLGQDRDDQQLTLSVVGELGLSVPLRFAPNGARMMEALESEEPMLVLLDYNLKPETGFELLEQIKQQPQWRHLPVVLLGESVDAGFVRRCYAAGACSYIVKPRSMEGTRSVIRNFFTYWLQVAETPLHSSEQNPQNR